MTTSMIIAACLFLLGAFLRASIKAALVKQRAEAQIAAALNVQQRAVVRYHDTIGRTLH